MGLVHNEPRIHVWDSHSNIVFSSKQFKVSPSISFSSTNPEESKVIMIQPGEYKIEAILDERVHLGVRQYLV